MYLGRNKCSSHDSYLQLHNLCDMNVTKIFLFHWINKQSFSAKTCITTIITIYHISAYKISTDMLIRTIGMSKQINSH